MEILDITCEYLSGQDLRNAQQTCRLLREIIASKTWSHVHICNEPVVLLKSKIFNNAFGHDKFMFRDKIRLDCRTLQEFIRLASDQEESLVFGKLLSHIRVLSLNLSTFDKSYEQPDGLILIRELLSILTPDNVPRLRIVQVIFQFTAWSSILNPFLKKFEQSGDHCISTHMFPAILFNSGNAIHIPKLISRRTKVLGVRVVSWRVSPLFDIRSMCGSYFLPSYIEKFGITGMHVSSLSTAELKMFLSRAHNLKSLILDFYIDHNGPIDWIPNSVTELEIPSSPNSINLSSFTASVSYPNITSLKVKYYHQINGNIFRLMKFPNLQKLSVDRIESEVTVFTELISLTDLTNLRQLTCFCLSLKAILEILKAAKGSIQTLLITWIDTHTDFSRLATDELGSIKVLYIKVAKWYGIDTLSKVLEAGKSLKRVYLGFDEAPKSMHGLRVLEPPEVIAEDGSRIVCDKGPNFELNLSELS